MLTNKHNLPESVVRLLSWDNYAPGENTQISCTGLLSPPHMRQLEAQHAQELTEDIVDRLWSVLGTGVHLALEQTAPEDALVEQRWYAEVLGWRISGQADLLHDGVLSDWKVTSVWSAIFGKAEWEQQLNILDWLAWRNGVEVNSLEINVICRDWQRGKASEENYPSIPVVTLPQTRWARERQQAFIEERVRYHQTPSDECTPEERWARPTRYAVVKKGRKRALRVLDTLEEAYEWADASGLVGEDTRMKAGHCIEPRPGNQWVRCDYCRVKDVCKQYKEAH